MIALFVRSWKPLAWRGALALAFGLVAFLWPQMTLTALVLVFGAYALLDGLIAIALSARFGTDHAWLFLLEGLAGVGLGLAVMLWTGAAEAIFVTLVGFWAITTGILELLAGLRLRELALGVAGGASGFLGLALMFRPAIGAVLLVDLLGAYMTIFGAAMLAQASRLRRLLRRVGNFDEERRDGEDLVEGRAPAGREPQENP